MKNFIFLVLLIIQLEAQCQGFYMQRYSDQNGLPDNELFDLHQDKQGYIWIACNSGLIRFSGAEFKRFSHIKQRMPALANMQALADGSIWMHDFGDRIFRFRPSTLELVSMPINEGGGFPTLAADVDGRHIWVCNNNSIQLLENSTRVKQKVKLHIPNNRSIYAGLDGLWIASNGKLACVSKLGILKEYPVLDAKNSAELLTDKVFFVEYQRTMFAFLRGNKTLYALQNRQFKPLQKLSQLPDLNGIKVIDNQFWLLTRKGIWIMDKDWNLKEILLQQAAISDVLIDDEKSLWISTLDNGLFQVPEPAFRSLMLPIGVSTDAIKKLSLYKNTLLAGTQNGDLIRWKNDQPDLVFQAKERKEISFLFEDDYGKLWFGNNDLCTFKDNQTTRIASNPGTKHMTQLCHGWALGAGSDGFSLVSTDEKTRLPEWLKKFVSESEVSGKTFKRLSDVRSWSCFGNANKQVLLVAGKNGLLLFKDGQQSLVLAAGEPLYASSICGNDNYAFAGTHLQGMWRINLETGLAEPIEELNRLIGNSSVILAKWEAPYLVTVTDNSVYLFNPYRKSILELGKQSGLISGRIRDALLFNKNLLLASSSGLISYPIELLKKHSTEPRAYLVAINGKERVDFPEQLSLKSQQLNLRFNLVGFKQRNLLQLRYRIQSGNWKELNPGEENLNLLALPEGDYPLDVQVKHIQSGKTKDVTRLLISVPVPFYRNPIALLMLLFVLGLILSLLWKYRIKSLKQKNQELLEKEQLHHALKSSMLASIKSQMNPHFLFNALNTIQSFILQNDRMKANFYLGKFSDLMRKILNMSARDTILLEEELEALKLYLELEKMRFNDGLTYTISLPNEELLDIEIPSMIIQPYVENAIKHGLLHSQGEKLLWIRFSQLNEKVLLVEIEDNGIGRKAAEQLKSRLFTHSFQSFSTQANKQRLELLNEHLSTHIGVEYLDKSEHGQALGTLVKLYIPY